MVSYKVAESGTTLHPVEPRGGFRIPGMTLCQISECSFVCERGGLTLNQTCDWHDRYNLLGLSV